jgi:hypothetical protein
VGFKIVRQGKHIVMSDGSHFITIPRHNPVNALTMAGIVKDAGMSVEEFRHLLCRDVSKKAGRMILLRQGLGVILGLVKTDSAPGQLGRGFDVLGLQQLSPAAEARE